MTPPSFFSLSIIHPLVNSKTCTAVVYLKNKVLRSWAPEENSRHKPIPEEGRLPFRNRLIPFLASSPPPIRSQLLPILSKILQYDFPEKWPDFMDITIQLLNTNDANSVFAGLQCLLAICRVYRFKPAEKRPEFDKIVEISFPQLLNIGTRLLAEESLEAGEMLRVVVKSYKHAIYVSHDRRHGYGLFADVFSWCSSSFHRS